MEAFLVLTIVAATPLLYAAIGELVVERSGVLNLGVEGMMLVGAIAAFATALSTGSSLAGVIAGAAAGTAVASLFGLVALGFTANQTATGLALTIFGTGLSALVGSSFVGKSRDQLAKFSPPEALADNAIARVLLGQDPMVYGAFILSLLVWFYLSFTRSGLKLRAVGDNADSAHGVGLKVLRTRFAAILFGGACAGLGGAYLSLAANQLWAENMTAGRGWIALALVVFAGWSPLRMIVGALIFAAASLGQFYGEPIKELLGFGVPSQILAMSPYLATIIALVAISVLGPRINMPAMLGKPFRAPR